MEQQNMIIFIIDTSGSMNSPSSNNVESKMYSRLDFAKQSAIFAMNALQDGTMVSVITFNSIANIVTYPIKLNYINKSEIINNIKRMNANSTTNIMSGLVKCQELINHLYEYKPYVILLSDGDDHVLTIDNIETKFNESFGYEPKFNMDTVGFGAEANTKLLVKMSRKCSGTYSLCYDSSMVGTIFGRALVRTYMKDQVFGVKENNISNTPEYIELRTKFYHYIGLLSDVLLREYRFRDDANKEIIDFTNDIKEYLKTLTGTNNISLCWYEYLCLIYSDCTDQLLLATTSDLYWNQWGKAYWTTMGIAFDKQYAPNFKDKSLQCFGTQEAKNEYERLSSIYDSLEMITPSLSNQISTTPVYASNFNDVDGGCFHSSSTLLSSSNEPLSCMDIICALNKKENVFVKGYHNGSYGNVEIETIIVSPTSKQMFCNIDGCILTPNHPIFYNGKWEHPKNITQAEIMNNLSYVFNIILTKVDNIRSQSIMVNNKQCICLGHGVKDGSVAEDSFWGTEKVIDCIKQSFNDNNVIETKMINLRDFTTYYTTNLTLVPCDRINY